MILEKISYKKITTVALFISLVDVFFIAIYEKWFDYSFMRRLFEESFIHLTFVIIIITLFYFSAKVDSKLWFTKYILSGGLLLLILLYNFGAIYFIFSKSYDVPYSISIILLIFISIPILSVLFIISLVERYLNKK